MSVFFGLHVAKNRSIFRDARQLLPMQAIGRLVRSSSRLSGGSESRSGSPWDATTARERQETAESQLSHWRQRARNAEKDLEIAKAAMNSQQDVRGQISKGHSDMYFEGRVQRERMRRNHPSNRAVQSFLSLLSHPQSIRTTCGQASSRCGCSGACCERSGCKWSARAQGSD